MHEAQRVLLLLLLLLQSRARDAFLIAARSPQKGAYPNVAASLPVPSMHILRGGGRAGGRFAWHALRTVGRTSHHRACESR